MKKRQCTVCGHIHRGDSPPERCAKCGVPKEKFVEYAGDIGINGTTFSSCYDNDVHGEAIDADLALATKVGATGTPTFFINGQKLVGAQPLAAFEAALNEALGE